MPLKNYKKSGDGSTAKLPDLDGIFRDNKRTRTFETDMDYTAQVRGVAKPEDGFEDGTLTDNGR